MSLLIIGGATALVGTGLKAYEGISQNAKANAIQKGLKDPTYNIPAEFYQNRDIARQMAQIGLPQQQYNNQVNSINQNQAAAIAAASRSANPGAAISTITRNTDNATANLGAQDAAARQNNERYFINQNTALGNQELAKQQSDVFDKYTRDFNQMQAYRGAGQQNLMSSAQDAVGLGMQGINYALQNQSTSGGRIDANSIQTASPAGFLPYNQKQYGLPYFQQ